MMSNMKLFKTFTNREDIELLKRQLEDNNIKYTAETVRIIKFIFPSFEHRLYVEEEKIEKAMDIFESNFSELELAENLVRDSTQDNLLHRTNSADIKKQQDMPNEQLVTVAKFNDPIEASQYKSVLDNKDIHSIVYGADIINVNPLYANAMGGIELKVTASCYKNAVKILEDYEEKIYS